LLSLLSSFHQAFASLQVAPARVDNLLSSS
jgi:hypothetical protein